MMCKPGSSLRMYYYQSKKHHQISIIFNKASHNVLSVLKLGECAFKDRPIWGDEPNLIIFKKKNSKRHSLTLRVQVNKILLRDESNLDYEANYLFNSIFKKQNFVFCAEVKNLKKSIRVEKKTYRKAIVIKSAGKKAKCN